MGEFLLLINKAIAIKGSRVFALVSIDRILGLRPTQFLQPRVVETELVANFVHQSDAHSCA